MDFILFLDISYQLSKLLPFLSDDIQLIDSDVTSIQIPRYSLNNIDYTLFDFTRFTLVTSIEIGDDCFESVQTFKIEGLRKLKSVKIGKNSFTQVKKGHWDEDKVNNQSKSFHILDCESLESIQIGEFIFSDFGGEFELSNLKSLKSIQIGTIGSDSSNFYWSSFVIRGIDMILTIE